jgi:hypothetical protein
MINAQAAAGGASSLSDKAHSVDPIDPVFSGFQLLPLSEPGGVQRVVPNEPTSTRPFIATLGIARPFIAKKHDTNVSKETYRTNDDTSKDGVIVTDSTVDTDYDS